MKGVAFEDGWQSNYRMVVMQSRSRLRSRVKIIAGGGGGAAVAMGAMVLAGWWAGNDLMKSVLPGMGLMHPMVATCFILTGGSLWLRIHTHGKGPAWLAQSLAGLVLAAALLRVGSYLTGWDFPAENWFLSVLSGRQEGGGGIRVAPKAALGFIFLCSALLMMDRAAKPWIRPVEILAALTGLLGSLSVLGHIYEARWLGGSVSPLPMAMNTAVTFMVMAIGVLCARPDRGVMEVVTGDSAGGLLVRRMFPAMILVFIFAGALKLMGERRGYFNAELGVALYTVASIGIFGVFVLWCARSLHQAELDRQRVETERERFFRLSLDILGIAGTDGYFKRVNPAFCNTLGYTSDEILSRPCLDFIHPDDVAPTLAEMGKLKRGEASLHFENRYRCKDGSWKWLAWNTQPFIGEGTLYATARDVTERKISQLAILSLNAELLQQTARLEGVNHELESFSHSVSHDLRAPLRGISGFAQALEEHAGDALDIKSQGYLQRVRFAAERMGHLIDDLLKLSRLTRAEMKVEVVNLSSLARSLVGELATADPTREVEVVIAPDLEVMGDPALLRILMDNLLGNAWKFTSKTPAAKIEVGCDPPAGGRVSCFVRDNGAGFDKRYGHKLFGAFQRLHAQVEFPGTGIGLATVQRIVRRHGGEVRADGEINHGATFGFTLEAVSKH